MTRYLLGQLSEAERDACEQEWFTDKVQYVQLCEVENALIDDYVRGVLSGPPRKLFEQQFLTLPARRERVMTAQLLLQEIAQQTVVAPAPQARRWFDPWSQFRLFPTLAWATVALLLVIGGWYFVRQRRSPTPLQSEQARGSEVPALPRPSVSTPPESLPPPPKPPPSIQSPTQAASTARTLLFALSAGTLRGEDAAQLPILRLNKNVQRVQFQVLLPPNDYRQFSVELQAASGEIASRWNGLRAARQQLGVVLSADRLSPGDYVMVIRGVSTASGSEEIRRLPFNVRR